MRGLSTLALLLGADALEHRVNPIRKVVTMLQMMNNKVEADGKKAEAIYDKFMCYCANAETLLGGAITAAENKIPQLESGIKEAVAEKKQLEADLKAHKADRAAAKAAIEKATGLREKEAAAFAKEKSDGDTNIAALAKAIPAIEKGMSGFLQTGAASVLRSLSVSMDMSSVDREMLASFLSAKSGYAPASGEILGILKTMEDEMVADLAAATANEEAAIKAFEGLVAAKTKEINALQKSIETKTARVGEIAVKTAEAENDLEDTKEDLEESKKFLADLDQNCENKKTEWAEYQKMQAQELLALADTIKVLNDDDALELFKKTLPSGASSFLQIQVTDKSQRNQAIQALRETKDPRIDLLAVALRGGKIGFGKIIKLIDELVATLKKEGEADTEKKEWCEAEIDKTEDNVKILKNEISDLETAIDDAKESISTLKVEIEALDDGIKALDKEVADYTEQREEAHAEYTETMAGNNAAVDLLKFAMNRLNKFYNPKLYKPPPKRELSEEDQITLNMGGTLAPTEAPGGIAGTGIGLVQAAPPPPPAANLAYKKKGEESSGVIQMIKSIIADVEKEIQVGELEEKDAQSDYEKFMGDAKAKRADDSKSMSDKEGALAETTEQLVTDEEGLKNTKISLMEAEKTLGGLHGDCDWLLKYYDARAEARVGEIEALGKAKDVLNGANY
jgi:septal ring factor EnvC (AmiA/AmiB activator)